MSSTCREKAPLRHFRRIADAFQFKYLAAALCMSVLTIAPASVGTPAQASIAPKSEAIFSSEILTPQEAWAYLLKAAPTDKTRAYWLNATAFLNEQRGAEAIGMLDLLQRQYPAAVVKPEYLLARGKALALLQRYSDAMVAFNDPALLRNGEACMWRLRVAAAIQDPADRSAEYNCATPALAKLDPEAQIPFLVAFSQLAYARGDFVGGFAWVNKSKIADSGLQLVLAKLLLATNRTEDARRTLAKVEDSGDEAQRAQAALLRLKSDYIAKVQSPDQILKGLEKLRYSWRDGKVELEALTFEYEVAHAIKDKARLFAVGATLLRNFPNIPNRQQMLIDYRAMLVGVLDPKNGLSLDQSIGTYWEYRDLGPDGAEGDRLAMLMASRLEEAGLYARAAQLVEYQMNMRAVDIAKGPLSIRAGILNIKAGQFNRALDLIQKSDGPRYPADVMIARNQLTAVALSALKRVPEALAVLDDVPRSNYLAAEILWHNQQWEEVVKIQASMLPRGQFGPADKTVLFRQIIALSNLGRNADIATLRSKYRRALAAQPELAAFDLLTAPADQVDPAAAAAAMTKLPNASPAGAFGDLLNLAPESKPAPRR